MSPLKTYCEPCGQLSPPIFTLASGEDGEGTPVCVAHGGPKPAPVPKTNGTEVKKNSETAAAISKHERRLAAREPRVATAVKKEKESVMAATGLSTYKIRQIIETAGVKLPERCECGKPYQHPSKCAGEEGSFEEFQQNKKKKKPAAAKPNGRAATLAAHGGHGAVATVCVTEGALNRWWEALDIQQKADAFTRVME